MTQFINQPDFFAPAVEIIKKYYDLDKIFSGRTIEFVKGDSLNVACSADLIRITYNTANSAMRGFGLAMAKVDSANENCPFEHFGVMIDCSRNGVMTLEYAKSVLVKLALCGYNLAMLYTEDTYILEDEPHFGYLRGGYSLEEVRELDEFAFSLGIELIGCIQTLGHLGTFLKSGGSAPVRDTSSVMMAEADATYELIGKMLDFWSRGCRSRRIHIGMDETHDLGRGVYLDKNGYKRNFDIFNGHLQKVCGMCRENGLEPMIWSDMYFRMANAEQIYYMPDADIPVEVKNAIPSEVQLVYWDYYHTTEDMYDAMIASHRKLDKEPLLGSGLWTWSRFIYDHEWTFERVLPCLRSARKNKLKDFFFTMWGDDGAYCDFDSVLAGLLRSADCAFGRDAEDIDRLEKISAALGCRSYRQTLLASKINWLPSESGRNVIFATLMVWDDPLLRMAWHEGMEVLKDSIPQLLDNYDKIAVEEKDFPYAAVIAKYLADKIRLNLKADKAYAEKDRELIRKIAQTDIPLLISDLDSFLAEFRRQWLSHYRHTGMESIQIRLGGLQARYREFAAIMLEFADNKTDVIPEFEVSYAPGCKRSIPVYLSYATPGLL